MIVIAFHAGVLHFGTVLVTESTGTVFLKKDSTQEVVYKAWGFVLNVNGSLLTSVQLLMAVQSETL